VDAYLAHAEGMVRYKRALGKGHGQSVFARLITAHEPAKLPTSLRMAFLLYAAGVNKHSPISRVIGLDDNGHLKSEKRVSSSSDVNCLASRRGPFATETVFLCGSMAWNIPSEAVLSECGPAVSNSQMKSII